MYDDAESKIDGDARGLKARDTLSERDTKAVPERLEGSGQKSGSKGSGRNPNRVLRQCWVCGCHENNRHKAKLSCYWMDGNPCVYGL